MAMPGPSLGAGEEVLITAHAVHKKSSGTVWFTTRRALWRAADGKAAVQRVEVAWAAVMSFQVCVCVCCCIAVFFYVLRVCVQFAFVCVCVYSLVAEICAYCF